MKNFLLQMLCFIAMQIISCSIGTIEIEPGATKFSIKNDSKIVLQNVKWNKIDFGNIELGDVSEKIVSAGQGYVYFYFGNKQYSTYDYISVEKHKREEFYIHANTFVTAVNQPQRLLRLEEIEAEPNAD
jgi:hypothetical protein